MKMRKRLLALLLALVMLVALCACGGEKTPSGDEPNNSASQSGTADAPVAITENAVFRTLYASEVTTLNYLITTQDNEMSILANVIDCLVEYDAYGAVEPALALSWSSNEDASVWTFKLREGVKWVDKDGNEMGEVTAADFVAAAQYVCDANHSAAGVKQLTSIIAGAADYNSWTAYQIALPTATDGVDENGNAVKYVTNSDGEQEILEEVAEFSADDIGVKALDPYTLEYTLNQSCPYFISMVSTGVYMPVSAELLASAGDKFGTSNEYLWYCGPYVLSSYQPQNQRIMTKNASYWEPECVYIDSIEQKYNAEASSISATMYEDGSVDSADIASDLLSAMMAEPKYASQIHPSRSDTSYSYWYLFNFDPNFDEEYEPDNWKIAVNNENFRQSIVHALNRVSALYCYDTLDPTGNKTNTITPAGFASASADYSTYGNLAAYTDEYWFDTEAALSYKEAAVAELTAAGATFPVKILLPYNPTSSNWANECQVVEQKLEDILGADYIDVIVEAGPDTGFLGAVRKTGKYALMKCNWGADYADPETWTDPFVCWDAGDGTMDSYNYSFIYMSEDPDTQALYSEYMDLVNVAKAITNDMDARYEAFAAAENLLLEHAFALPIHTNSRSYSMSKLNVFEGQYAPFGVARLRYKDQHMYDRSMSIEEYQAAYAQWQAVLAD